jgi:hypothetical protein
MSRLVTARPYGTPSPLDNLKEWFKTKKLKNTPHFWIAMLAFYLAEIAGSVSITRWWGWVIMMLCCIGFWVVLGIRDEKLKKEWQDEPTKEN